MKASTHEIGRFRFPSRSCSRWLRDGSCSVSRDRFRGIAGLGCAGARTPEGARAVHRRGREGPVRPVGVIGGRAQWVNATYITDDTDALAAYFGTIGTEKGVAYAKEAARMGARCRASIPTPRASSTSCAARWCSPRRRPPGRGRAQHHLDPAAVDLRQGPRDARGKEITGDDAEELMGTLRNPAELKEVWTSWHEQCRPPDARRLHAHGRDRQPGRQGARLRRHRRHVAVELRHEPEEFSAMYDRLWAR
jgi:peptidyl-dipeptidase A